MIKSRHRTGIFSIIIFLILFKADPGFTAFEKKGFGPLFAGSGYTGVASARTHFPTLNNPALLAQITNANVQFHGQDFYGIRSLYLTAADFHTKIRGHAAGLSIIKYGNNNYQEISLSSALGKQYGPLKIGLRCNLHLLQIKNYGQTKSVSITIGAAYAINHRIRIGLLLDNINAPELGSSGEYIPQNYNSGIEITAADEIKIRLDISKNQEDSFEYHFGVDYQLSRELLICFGYQEKIGSVTCGMVLSYFRFELGYAMNYHMVLGASNILSIGYEL